MIPMLPAQLEGLKHQARIVHIQRERSGSREEWQRASSEAKAWLYAAVLSDLEDVFSVSPEVVERGISAAIPAVTAATREVEIRLEFADHWPIAVLYVRTHQEPHWLRAEFVETPMDGEAGEHSAWCVVKFPYTKRPVRLGTKSLGAALAEAEYGDVSEVVRTMIAESGW